VQSAANAPTISKTDKDRDGNWGFISSVGVAVLVQKLRPPHKFARAASNTLVSQITLWLKRFEREPTPKKRAAPTEMNGGFSSAERRPMSKSLGINSARLALGGLANRVWCRGGVSGEGRKPPKRPSAFTPCSKQFSQDGLRSG
jgi:hypothetical protein